MVFAFLLQEQLQAAKQELEKLKSALRERNKVHVDTCYVVQTLNHCTHTHTYTHTHTHTRTHTQELQKCEQEKRAHDKEKIECSLKVKELEHKIAKFHKDSRDAAQRVSKP